MTSPLDEPKEALAKGQPISAEAKKFLTNYEAHVQRREQELRNRKAKWQ